MTAGTLSRSLMRDVRHVDRRLLLVASGGFALAVVAVAAAPSSELLSAPERAWTQALAVLALGALFAAGLVRPVASLYALVLLVVLEGALRKWALNDVTMFMLKDFLLLGIYAAVLPTLSRSELRRPWWLLAPLGGLIALALAWAPAADSATQAAIGVRSYVVYVPLLWVGPKLLASRRRAEALLALVLVVGFGQALLAFAQAMAGPGWLNKLVSGALHATLSFGGRSYIRPPGTFMHVGVLSLYVFVAAIVALALIASYREGRLLRIGLVAPFALAPGIVYAGARSLLGGIVLAFLVFAALMLRRRRLLPLLAVPVSFVAAVALLMGVVPPVSDAVRDLRTRIVTRDDPRFVVTDQNGDRQVLWVDREEWEREPPDLAWVWVHGHDEQGRPMRVSAHVVEGPDGRREHRFIGWEGRVTIEVLLETIQTDVGRGPESVPIETDTGKAPVGGYLGRAIDLGAAGTADVGIWSTKLRPQLELIGERRLAGEGTGTMTLGTTYADPDSALAGESMYAKYAWELGLPGLALFSWLIAAVAVLAAKGAARARDWRRAPALVGAGVAGIFPLWFLISFALDVPIAGLLYFLFAGFAVALGSGAIPASSSSQRSPMRGHESSRS